ncbi:MAG: class I SAM-dependent methyltransferase [Ktedonobacterales bacterium]|nr:class I SAM-dependent methyltransferase [Ktedonobacterales bacterium]
MDAKPSASETAGTLAGIADDASAVKACCAATYSSDWARLLLGESFHPGGMALTERLGELLRLGPGSRVLDVAAGKGASAIHLARTFGCGVVGVELSAENVREATQAAERAGVSELARFERDDAEQLAAAEASFDALICECAFCTFPDKRAAAAEFARVLRPGGHVGMSDLTRTGDVPADLRTLLAWVACIADAQPIGAYSRYLEDAGLTVDGIEAHDDALAAMVQDIRTRLMGAELLVKMKKIALPGADFAQARETARAAAAAVRAGQFGYAILTATKSA